MSTRHVVKYGAVGDQYTLPTPIGDHQFSIIWDQRGFIFEQPFLIQGESAADFKAKLQTAEEKLQLANGRLTVLWNGQTTHDFNPDLNTGLGLKADLLKRASQFNTQISRELVLRVTGRLPASDQYGTTDGTSNYTIAEQRDASNRPIYTFRGEITAEGVLSASDNITALKGDTGPIRAWLRANGDPVEVAVGDSQYPKYELVQQNIAAEDQNKTTPVELVYRLRIVDESESTKSDSRWTVDQLVITPTGKNRMGVNPFDNGAYSLGTNLPETFVVTCNVSVNRAEVDWNGAGGLMGIMYGANGIFDALVYQIEQSIQAAGILTVSPSNLHITSKQLQADLANSKIAITLQLEAPAGSMKLLKYEHNMEYDLNYNEVAYKIADGEEFTYEVQSTGKDLFGYQTITGTVLGQSAPSVSNWQSILQDHPGPGGKWRPKRTRVRFNEFDAETFGSNKRSVPAYDFFIMRECAYRITDAPMTPDWRVDLDGGEDYNSDYVGLFEE